MCANWYTHVLINPQPTPPLSPVIGSNKMFSKEENNLIDNASSTMNPREAVLKSVARQLRARNRELELAAVSNNEDLGSTEDFNKALVEQVTDLCVFNCCMGMDLAASRAMTNAHLIKVTSQNPSCTFRICSVCRGCRQYHLHKDELKNDSTESLFVGQSLF